MIDNFSLLISHGLLALLCWRLLSRPDLDKEGGAPSRPATSVRPELAEARPAAMRWGRATTSAGRTGTGWPKGTEGRDTPDA